MRRSRSLSRSKTFVALDRLAVIGALVPTARAQSSEGRPVKEQGSLDVLAPVTEGTSLPSSANGPIAWDSDRVGTDLEIWRMNPDGSSKTQLTFNTCTDRNPEWSPDGLWIAYESDCGGDFEIWVMSMWGASPAQLTNNIYTDTEPTWSPDGSRIAFDSDRDTPIAGTPTWDVYWMNADGTDETRLTSSGYQGSPNWSSDGHYLAMQRRRVGTYETLWDAVWVEVTPGSTNNSKTSFAWNPVWQTIDPAWAPDDSKVAFARRSPGNEGTNNETRYSITTVNPNGSGMVILTNDGWHDLHPAWSPDGNRIVFETEQYAGSGEDSDIIVMNANGTGRLNLNTEDTANDSRPDWAPTDGGDQDDDALLDLWEINGLWGWSCYGTASECTDPLEPLEFVNLPAMGANPTGVDIFVEVDHMTGYDPLPAAMADVVTAFGNRGINLHLDFDTNAPLTGMTGTWDSLSRANSIHLTYNSPLGSWTLGNNGEEYRWFAFETLKGFNFSVARSKIFRYAIFAEDLPMVECDDGRLECRISGVARGIPGSDFIVSLGAWSGGTTAEQSGTFMHELGHTLGLGHGGGDHINYKPNYRSVMNYFFQMTGVPVDGLDYSDTKLATLDESDLDETVGIYDGFSRTAATRYYCFGREFTDWFADKIDWNCNLQNNEVGVHSVDINDDDSTTSVLVGHDDWGAIDFFGGSVGGGGLVAPLAVDVTTPPEVTHEMYEQQMADLEMSLQVRRYAGTDRFATSAEISESDFPNPGAVDVVFVATGYNYPDALAGAAVAGHLGAPLLLVKPDSVPGPVSFELSRLDPDVILVLGGSDVVSDGVKASLGAYAPSVIRLEGPNRYATAVEISKYGYPDPGVVDTVFIATGLDFPDALTGAAAAGALDAPLLLVRQGDIPGIVAQELGRLSPDTIVMLGGSDVVSDGVKASLGSYASTVIRLQGANRYSTAVEISKYAFPSGASRVYLATGLNFPDALAGAAAAGSHGAPVLLVPGTSVPGPTWNELTRLGVSEIVLLGEVDVVGAAVEAQMHVLLGI